MGHVLWVAKLYLYLKDEQEDSSWYKLLPDI